MADNLVPFDPSKRKRKPKEPRKPTGDWRDSLIYAKDGGSLCKHVSNIITLVSHDEAWRGVLAFDEFAQKLTKVRAPPWSSDESPGTDLTGEWRDEDSTRLASWLARQWQLQVSPETAEKAVPVVARAHPFHPVRDYLNGLSWDGTMRLSNVLHTHFGAEDTEHNRAIGRWWLISAVARIYQPGCQVDHVLIAEGKQGVYKSTAMELLFGKKWHCGEMPDLGSKDSFIQLPGKWVIELQELEVFSKVESQRAKSFFTASVDRYRASYGRHAVDWPRQCVFYGTTNDDQYLRDETGNRRYWPFHTGFIDRDAIARDRDQIWAEAREAYRGGAQWWPDSLSDKEMCSDEQAKRQRRDEWEGLISHHIDVKNPVWISVKSILSDVLSIEPGKWSRQDQMRVAHCLVSLGWTRKIVSAEFHPGPNKKRFWAYVKGDEECHGISATQ